MPYVAKTKIDNNMYPIGSALYGTCSTAANQANKTVTLSDFDTLITGVTLHVKFTNSNTASNPKLVVGSEGQAKSIYRYGTTVPGTTEATSWPAGAMVSFTYTGDAWIMNDWNNTDENTHYTSKLVIANNSTATTDTSGTITGGTVYVNHVENSARTSSVPLTGGGGTTVVTNSNGQIQITSPSLGSGSTQAAPGNHTHGEYATKDELGDLEDFVAALPEPMVFKGSVGTNGTVTWVNLPTAGTSNTGFTYKVITDHTAETGKPAAKIGDTIISDGSNWVVIPSGDEPSGTVTSVGITEGTGIKVSGTPITSSGLITVGHSNSVTAQPTQAVYPIKIDAQGHISGYGSAVTVPVQGTWYGTSSTTASTAAKVVTCSGFTLTAGAVIGVLFSTANTAATPTLNVNSTGAKTIYVGGNTALDATANVLKWSANTMIYFMYDGTYFRYITSVSAGSVAPSRGANTWYGTSSTGATTQAKTSTIDNFVLTKGAVVYITFSTANTYTSAKLTLNINSTGAKDVYYNNAVTSSTNTLLWNAGETLVFIYSGSYYYYAGKSITKTSQLANDSGFITSSDIPGATQSATTGISISDHGTTSVGSASNWSAGSASSWVFEDITCDDITSWSAGSGSYSHSGFSGGSGSFAAEVDNNHIMSFSHTHTAAVYGTDSHTHTAPSLSYTGKTVSSKKSGSNGTVPSLTITSTTVVDGKTHTITDNGHTHSI